jgi:hypothetical protein
MNRCENLVTIGFANIAVLDEKVLGVLAEAWGREDTEGGCTVILKWSRILLWISKPGQIVTVELDMLGSYREGRINGDLGRLDLRDDLEGSVARSNAKGDGKLVTSSGRMYGESSVAGGNEDRSFRSEPGWSEVLASAEVSE